MRGDLTPYHAMGDQSMEQLPLYQLTQPWRPKTSATQTSHEDIGTSIDSTRQFSAAEMLSASCTDNQPQQSQPSTEESTSYLPSFVGLDFDPSSDFVQHQHHLSFENSHLPAPQEQRGSPSFQNLSPQITNSQGTTPQDTSTTLQYMTPSQSVGFWRSPGETLPTAEPYRQDLLEVNPAWPSTAPNPSLAGGHHTQHPASEEDESSTHNTPTGPPFSCASCPASIFSDEAKLKEHIRKKHIRPFPCPFQSAGCALTFANKNEWKRHLLAQHIRRTSWECRLDLVSSLTAAGSSEPLPSDVSASSHFRTCGSTWWRKDSYRAHVRRKHMPAECRKGKLTPEWAGRLRQLQADAEKHQCALPTYLRCPVRGCKVSARGPNAWDQCIEHVATHCKEKAETNELVQFGSDADLTLTGWT